MELPFAFQGILSTDSGTIPSNRFKFNFPFDPLTLLHLDPGMYGVAETCLSANTAPHDWSSFKSVVYAVFIVHV